MYFFTRIGGKHKVAPLLVEKFPPFQTYVEPFVGSGQVFLALPLEKKKKYILNDVDEDIYHLWKDVTKVSKLSLVQLPWEGNRERYYALRKQKLKEPLWRLYRNLYLSFYSFSGDKSGGYADKKCVRGKKFLDNFEALQTKVKHAHIYKGDYRRIVQKFDSSTTLFYLDPPYYGKEALYEGQGIDPKELLNVCRGIRGQFILSYNADPYIEELFRPFFSIYELEIPYTSGNHKKAHTEWVMTNF
jgi:DNA adenine methylase